MSCGDLLLRRSDAYHYRTHLIFQNLQPVHAKLNQREKAEIKEAEFRKECVVKEAEYRKLSAIHEAQRKHETLTAEADHKKDSAVIVSKHHYGLVANSEKQFDDKFFEIASTKRQVILDDDFVQWETTVRNGDGSSFEDFYRSTKKKLSTHRFS